MLQKRIVSSTLLLAATYMTIFVLPKWSFFILIAIFTIVGLLEFFSFLKKKGVYVHGYLGIILGTLLSASFYLQRELGIRQPELGITVLAIIGLFLLQLTRRDNGSAILSIASTLLGLLYVAWMLSFFVRLKYLPGGSGWLAFLILVAKSGDAGAYFVGTKFGRHKLIQRISPNKSLEGALGGAAMSLVVALVCKSFLPISFRHLFFLGFVVAILSQLGDLAESLIKRDAGVKDSGWIIPGLGGILDIIDSLLFTGPFLYFYLTLVLKL